jgi:import receptor subunit TOM70
MCWHQDLPAFYVFSDFTSATILDRFQNQGTAVAVERVLKALATKKAKEIMQVSPAD